MILKVLNKEFVVQIVKEMGELQENLIKNDEYILEKGNLYSFKDKEGNIIINPCKNGKNPFDYGENFTNSEFIKFIDFNYVKNNYMISKDILNDFLSELKNKNDSNYIVNYIIVKPDEFNKSTNNDIISIIKNKCSFHSYYGNKIIERYLREYHLQDVFDMLVYNKYFLLNVNELLEYNKNFIGLEY